MARARKPCRIPSCPELRPCPVEGHERRAWEGSTRRVDLPPDWSSRIVPRILARDPICTICDAALSTEVHHTGDRHDHRDEVLAGVCSRCHKAETAQQAAAARRGHH